MVIKIFSVKISMDFQLIIRDNYIKSTCLYEVNFDKSHTWLQKNIQRVYKRFLALSK